MLNDFEKRSLTDSDANAADSKTDRTHTSQQRKLSSFSLDQPIAANSLVASKPFLPIHSTLLGEHPLKSRNIMNDLATQISRKSKDSSQQVRIPAPATDKIDTNHDIDAKKFAHAPLVAIYRF